MIETPKTKRGVQRAIETLAGWADELMIGVALVLLGAGGWLAWRPLGFLLPGAVLLWCVLPARTGFVVHSEAKPGPSRMVVRK